MHEKQEGQLIDAPRLKCCALQHVPCQHDRAAEVAGDGADGDVIGEMCGIMRAQNYARHRTLGPLHTDMCFSRTRTPGTGLRTSAMAHAPRRGRAHRHGHPSLHSPGAPPTPAPRRPHCRAPTTPAARRPCISVHARIRTRPEDPSSGAERATAGRPRTAARPEWSSRASLPVCKRRKGLSRA